MQFRRNLRESSVGFCLRRSISKGANRAIAGNWNETNGFNGNFWNPRDVNPNLHLAPLVVSCYVNSFVILSILQAFFRFPEDLLGGGYSFFLLDTGCLWQVSTGFLGDLILHLSF